MRSSFVMLLAAAAGLFAAGELSGRRAPGFALPDSSLRIHDLYDYRGKVVLLDVMLTGCPNCQVLSRTLERVKAKYKDQVVVLSVVTPPDNQASVGAFIKQYNITSPILFDCGQMSASYVKATPQNPRLHVPHVFVIDQQGWIRNDFGHAPDTKHIFEGAGLDAEIDKLLAKPAK